MRSTFDREGELARAWGAGIATRRIQAGWTKADLAELCKVNRSTVGRWETGASPPTIVHQHILAKMFDTTIDDLFPLDAGGAD